MPPGFVLLLTCANLVSLLTVRVLGIALLARVISGIGPHDRLTWWLEVLSAVIGLVLRAATFARFPLSPLLYRLWLVHALILVVGGHYTHARVQVGFWDTQWDMFLALVGVVAALLLLSLAHDRSLVDRILVQG